MGYNFTHKDNLELFIKDNIKDYVENKNEFTFKKYVTYYRSTGKTEKEAKKLAKEIPTYSAIEVYLAGNFKKMLKKKAFRNRLDKKLSKINSDDKAQVKKEIQKVAVSLCMGYADVSNYYINRAMHKLEIEWSSSGSEYQKACVERFLAYQEFLEQQLTQSEMLWINDDVKKAFVESVDILFKGGFKKKLYDVDNGVNSGTKRSNEGDAAQFLFVARAILAGFSCSNVDVRTSPYDAVIDYNTFLLRVQVKGINHDQISFVTSTRGGAGVDTSAPTNTSRPITRSDCDIYVAVEKSSGLCYIIPIGDVEEYLEAGKKSLPESDKAKYRERWDHVEKEAKNRFRIK